MDNFWNFNSQLSQSRIPTPVELKEMKQMLLSGDKDQMLQAIEKIKVFTNTEEPLRELIRADISEFLCDAIKPFDAVILSSINNCLELMAKHPEFYSHTHSCFAIESTIRSVHFLMKDTYSVVNFNECLNLLLIILQGYKTHGVAPVQKTIENLLLLLPKIQKTVTPTPYSKYQIGLLILSLTDLNVSKWSQKGNDTILTSFGSWFNFLKEILETEHPMREKLILLCFTLCHSVIRCLVSSESPTEEFCTEIDEELKNEIIFNVCEFLINFGAPYFDNITLSEAEANPSHLENFYQTILYFYSDNLPHKNRLTHGLSQVEFLQFTTSVISIDEISHSQKIPRLCILVLFHMILSLSEDVFHFPEIWPWGRENFRSEIQKGIEELPLDPSQWLDALTSSQSSPSCKFALLLYLYFYCMTSKSHSPLQVIYPVIVTFIRSSTGIETSSLLVKAIWFIFVMSQLSVAENKALDNEMEANDEIVSLLNTQDDFRLVYTHHPAILYWAFSFKVNSQIQTKVVHLWLQNRTPDCREVEELIKKSPDFRYAILDTLQHGSDQVLDSAFSSLKSILMNSEGDDLASNIWFLLPHVLANFTDDAVLAKNVDYLIELSNLQCPKNIEVTRIIRIASLLPEVLLKSDVTSVPYFTLALNLLELALKMEDYRAVFVFLRSQNFVKKIIEDLSASVSDISLCSIRIVTLLWKDCGRVKQSENFEKIKLKKKAVLQILETNSEEILSAALDFIQQLLVTNFQSTFFIIENPDLMFVEILFLETQNICIKTSAELSSKCWQCLKLFLNVHINSDEHVHLELSTHPLLYELIRFFLPRLKDSKNMADFLMVWIDISNKTFQNPCYSRRIFGQFYVETMEMIARRIVEDSIPERQDLLQKVLSSGVVADLNLPQSHLLPRSVQPLYETTLKRIEPNVDLPLF